MFCVNHHNKYQDLHQASLEADLTKALVNISHYFLQLESAKEKTLTPRGCNIPSPYSILNIEGILTPGMTVETTPGTIGT